MINDYPHKMYINFGDKYPPIPSGVRLVKIESVGPKFVTVKYKNFKHYWFPKKFTREQFEEIYPLEKKNEDIV